MNVKKLFQFSIGPFGAAAIGIVILPFVAWFFSVEDVGRLTMLQIVLSLSISLFSLEMHKAYVREYHEEADKFSLLKVAALPGLILTTFLSFILLVSPISISQILFGIESEFLT
ncbi:MAG: polysaccharide biosynthesis family protein, partial [Paraglaciecola sp.]|nr:polysaccharide biosynthesis family protein [Paraglaciecola sp.]